MLFSTVHQNITSVQIQILEIMRQISDFGWVMRTLFLQNIFLKTLNVKNFEPGR